MHLVKWFLNSLRSRFDVLFEIFEDGDGERQDEVILSEEFMAIWALCVISRLSANIE